MSTRETTRIYLVVKQYKDYDFFSWDGLRAFFDKKNAEKYSNELELELDCVTYERIAVQECEIMDVKTIVLGDEER